jgi:hypothetical protein
MVFYILEVAVEIFCSCVYGRFLPTSRSVLKFHNIRHTQSLHCYTAHQIYESHECCRSEVILFVSKQWHSTFLCKNINWPAFYILSLAVVISSLGSRISWWRGNIHALLHSLFVFHICLLRYKINYLSSGWGLFLSTCFQMLVVTNLPLYPKQLTQEVK